MPAKTFDEMKIKLEEKNFRNLKKFLEPGSIVISYITSMFITKLQNLSSFASYLILLIKLFLVSIIQVIIILILRFLLLGFFKFSTKKNLYERFMFFFSFIFLLNFYLNVYFQIISNKKLLLSYILIML